MHLSIVVKQGFEGFDVSVPSIPECASWGSSEEQAIENILDRISYFFGLPVAKLGGIELARREGGSSYYTLVLRRSGDLTEPIQAGDEEFPR